MLRHSVPEVTALESWRLALGWTRHETVTAVGQLYRQDGLHPPGLSEAMLCRWEHGEERPGAEYAEALTRVYGATLRQLELARRCAGCDWACPPGDSGYGALGSTAPSPGAAAVTTAQGLPAVAESLQLAVADAPRGGPAVVAIAQAAVDHYSLEYSRHAPESLFTEVRRARHSLAGPLANPDDEQLATELRRAAGWMSALMGNLAHHLGDPTGARVHLCLAAALGDHCGDARLVAWTHGALAMTANAAREHLAALDHAEAGLARATSPLQRAQLMGWAKLPALAQMGRADAARATLNEADALLETAGDEPGRFGYDRAEHLLHTAEAQMALGHLHHAAAAAEESIGLKQQESPGWAAAVLNLCLAEAVREPGDAAGRALEVLDRVPVSHLRITSRTRLRRLEQTLSADTEAVRDLRERVRALPAPVDVHGRAAG
ncbi:hypothetical protein BIV57_00425 [Mangrovactinospora gilvigrisea]|uniref:HTH cro/C1-type domain-containing protein n=1 Tax=Mangrovactinospora gilvigrisea TaxID=1428644 RepID=A0A1J7BLC5_9ACTN|nr:hypothetical protein BIV57_00425 [Mangrovactinospora gilvigrisea]